MSSRILQIASALFMLVASLSATAAQRTFVASTGADANPCSLTLPCRGFAAAVAAVAAGGEVVVLDSAGYGPVTIDKAVSLIAPPGVYAGITAPATTAGVAIMAGSEDAVTLRGLTINLQGLPFVAAIDQSSGRLLTVDRCAIKGSGGAGAGVEIRAGDFLIRDSTFEGLDLGIYAGNPPGLEGTPFFGTVTGSTFHDVQTGIHVGSRVNLVLSDSVLVGRGSDGVGLDANANGSGSSDVHIAHSRLQRFWIAVAGNGVYQKTSITAVDSDLSLNDTAVACFLNTSISLSDVRVTHNQTGIATGVNSCPVFTSGTNYFRDNSSDGPLTGPVGIK